MEMHKYVKQDAHVDMDMTPMIDIVFLLIIFFMVGTKFTELEKQLTLEVPEVTDAGTLSPAPEKRVINVFKDGRFTLDRQDVTLSELVKHLQTARSEYAELGVIVRGDAESPLQNVAAALDACRQAGITDYGIAVKEVKLR